MNADLLKTLKALPTDPSRVVDLYSQLYAGSFVVPVQAGSETDLGTAMFLIYPTPDGVSELPLFTSRDYVLKNLPRDVVFVTVTGAALWPRLLDVVRAAGKCMAAVDPGQAHGIRLSESMILGMISSYKSKPANNENSSMADLVGPWADADWESGLIQRCKAAWNKPLARLTNRELATFLSQRIATDHILPIAKQRVENKVDDYTEIYEGELKEAIKNVPQP